MLRCIGASVFRGRLRLSITANDHVAVAATFVMMGLPSVAFCGVKLGALNLGCDGLKVSIDDKWGRKLLVVILEGELVLPLLWHLHPYSGLSDPSTFRLMGFQQVFPEGSSRSAEVLTLPVLALVIQKAVEILHPGVVEFSCLLD